MKTNFFILTLLFFISSQLNAQYKHGMWSNAPADLWRDALISGNGRMGILVFGNLENEKIVFNHELLYEFTGTENTEPPNIAPYLKKTQQLMLDGKYGEAVRYSADMAQKEGHAELLDTDPYHPAFIMNIRQRKEGEAKNYRRQTNFETGEITVSWTDNAGNWVRRSFVSRANNIVVHHIKNLSGNKFDASIDLEHYIGNKKKWWGKINKVDTNLLITDPKIDVNTGGWLSFTTSYKNMNRGYEGYAKVITQAQNKKIVDNRLQIEQTSEILIIGRINFLEQADKSYRTSTVAEINAMSSKYEDLLKPHAQLHAEIFNRTSIQFAKNSTTDAPVEELLAKQEANLTKIDPLLLQKMYEMGKYVLISASGENPPNLVGLWTGDWRPDWSGDYTLDANVNLQISGVNGLRLNEGLESYLGFIERISPDWKINAQKLYGARGFKSGIRTNGRRNLETHFGHEFTGQFWTAGAQWLIWPAFEHYLTTGDKKFLKQRVLPLLEQTALFYEDFLTVEDANSKFIFVPSYSPENAPSNLYPDYSGGAINATMDIAAAKQCLENLLYAYQELELKDEVKTKKWKQMLAKMPPYLINKDGAFKEWSTPLLADSYNHRHSSHLYPFWPSLELNPDQNPEMILAGRKALELRGDQDVSTHGVIMKALAATRLKMDTLVQEKLLQYLSGRFSNRSLVSNHFPDGRVYNTDGICAFPNVINEMLFYSKPGEIELLPAIPSQLKNGHIEGVASRTKVIVKKMEWDISNKIIKVTLTPIESQTIVLNYRKGIKKVHASANIAKQITANQIKLKLSKGKETKLILDLL